MKSTPLVLLIVLVIAVVSIVLLSYDSHYEIEFRAQSKEKIEALLRGDSVPYESFHSVSPAVLAGQMHYSEDVIEKLRKVEFVLPKQ